MYTPVLFTDEIFKDITLYPIAPYYQISNYGTVLNKNTNSQISAIKDDWGYLRVRLYLIDGTAKIFSVHRLVMITFHPIDNYKEMEINHIHGEKTDNHDTDLEWVTHSENMIHAYATGLNQNIRENNTNAIMKEDEIRIICENLEKGIPFIEIAKMISSSKSTNPLDVVRAVYKKKSWTSISKDYNFYNYGDRKHSLSKNEVNYACSLMEQGYKNSEITSMLGYGDSYKDRETVNMRNVVKDIRSERCYSDISKNYTFPLPKSKN